MRAHERPAKDMIFQGWLMSASQASQQCPTMSSKQWNTWLENQFWILPPSDESQTFGGLVSVPKSVILSCGSEPQRYGARETAAHKQFRWKCCISIRPANAAGRFESME